MALLNVTACNKRPADYLLVSQSTTLISNIYLYFPVYDFITRYRTLFYLYTSNKGRIFEARCPKAPHQDRKVEAGQSRYRIL